MKRVFDISISLAALVVLTPLLLFVALAVRLMLGSPVLFRQWRPGRGGKPFVLYKFRTMRDAVDSNGRLLSDSLRLTSFGRLLRATSIDELPELFNVLRGDMSLVGPRPLLVCFLPHYTAEQQRRHDVRPGLTGWAQINGRNDLSFDQKMALDVWYVEHACFWLDLKIIVRTVGAVLSRRGIGSTERCLPAALHSVPPEELLLSRGSSL